VTSSGGEGSTNDASTERETPRSGRDAPGSPGGRDAASQGGIAEGAAASGGHRGLADGPRDDAEAQDLEDSADASGILADRQVTATYTPLFRAQNEGRYLRRALLEDYQARHNCRLAVMIDLIHPDSVTLFAELLHGADPKQEFHLLLRSQGGDGEVAVRLARMAQAACSRFIVVVPDMAKSAATIFSLGADEIIMGPPSDLGPIDPQVFIHDRGYVSAKEIIRAVDQALKDASDRPNTFALHSALLGMGNVDATLYQFALSALDQTEEIAEQALGSNPRRSPDQVAGLVTSVTTSLITETRAHSAVVGASEAKAVGLPVNELRHDSQWWQEIWTLWTRYFALGVDDKLIYESVQASQVYRRFFEAPDRTESGRSESSALTLL